MFGAGRPLLLAALWSAAGCATVGSARWGEAIVWSEAVAPRVTVRADVDPEDAAQIAGEIEQLLDLLQDVVFPAEQHPREPLSVVLFTREEDYRLSHDRPVRTGHYLEWGLAGAELPASVFVLGKWDKALRGRVLHELVHAFVRFHYPSAPSWLNEGLATFYESTVMEDGRVVFGEPVRWGLGPQPLPTFEALMRMSDREFHLGEVDLNDRDYLFKHAAHYRAAWIAVHFLSTAEEPWRARLEAYLAGLGRGLTDAAAFAAAFGAITPADIERAALDQFSFNRIPTLRTAYAPRPPPPVRARVLRAAEVQVMRAWYRSSETGVDRARAYEELERALADEPTLAEAHLWRGHLRRHDGDVARARVDFARARELAPEDSAVLVAELDLALEDHVGERRAEAAAVIDRDVGPLARVAVSPLALFTVARALGARGKLDAALDFARRATDREPRCAHCWALRAELCASLERYADALPLMEQAVRHARTDEVAAELEARRRALAAEVEAARSKAASP